jgi:hypothetical protein
MDLFGQEIRHKIHPLIFSLLILIAIFDLQGISIEEPAITGMQISSLINTLILDASSSMLLVCLNEHATSHNLHPEHFL